jgi:hypothetical protein
MRDVVHVARCQKSVKPCRVIDKGENFTCQRLVHSQRSIEPQPAGNEEPIVLTKAICISDMHRNL